MRKVFFAAFCLIFIFVLFGCSNDEYFIEREDGTLESPDGIVYKKIANEGMVSYIGELEFAAHVKGEKTNGIHMGYTYKTGVFKIKDSVGSNIIIRKIPNNEFYAIYIDSRLEDIDFSLDNCIRLEYQDEGYYETHGSHATCGYGINGREAVADFLNQVRLQPTSGEAGLYDSIRKSDGTLENCRCIGYVYGYYEDEA